MAASMAEVREIYLELSRVARGCCRSAGEARDVVQDAFEVALTRGFDDWAAPPRRAWLRGVIRKRAAFLARGEGRRRLREQLPDGLCPGASGWTWQPAFLASLPRGLRRVAALASADLNAAEIRWVLGLTDPALRQRISALRRAVRAAPERPTMPAAEPAFSLGGRRAHLLTALRSRPGAGLATHDPDGHPILLCRLPHKRGTRGNSSAKEKRCLDPS